MPTVPESSWDAWHAFHVMRRRLDRALETRLQSGSSISGADYETLIALQRSPDRQLRMKELAVGMGWEKSRLSHQVARMEKRGLVERAQCETDARGAWVSMTTEGRRTVLAAMRGHNAALSRYFFDALDPAEVAEFGRLSGKIHDAIRAACDGVGADACEGTGTRSVEPGSARRTAPPDPARV